MSEPLLGFRWWHVEETASGVALLTSWIQREPWSLGWNRAAHDTSFSPAHPSAVPKVACDCGFYGWYRLERATKARWDYTTVSHEGPSVAGAFIAAGRIVHHGRDGGFRAELAKPIAFCRVNRAWDPGMTNGYVLAEQMGLPMLQDQGFELLCREWGELRI